MRGIGNSSRDELILKLLVIVVYTIVVMTSNYYTAIHQIIRTGHWITDQISQELKEHDVTEPQFNVLRILRGRKGNPVTVVEIQEQMVQRTSNVTRIIDKLLVKGLVDRQECHANRRKMDITITEKGRTFLFHQVQQEMSFPFQ